MNTRHSGLTRGQRIAIAIAAVAAFIAVQAWLWNHTEAPAAAPVGLRQR